MRYKIKIIKNIKGEKITDHKYYYETDEDYNLLVKAQKKVPFECWDEKGKVFIFKEKVL